MSLPKGVGNYATAEYEAWIAEAKASDVADYLKHYREGREVPIPEEGPYERAAEILREAAERLDKAAERAEQ